MNALAYKFDYPEAAEFDTQITKRSRALSELVKQLKTFPAESSRDEFAHSFRNACRVLELGDLELSRLFRVSRPTIGRWMRGEAAPHPLGRPAVFASLVNIARQKIKACRR